jgi:uncharacterized protein YbjT (DUF2867 family)
MIKEHTMSTILVTGGTGGLGRHLVGKLLQRGHQVRIHTRQAHPNLPNSVSAYQGDIREGSGLAEATNGVDTIIHCVSVYEEGFATDIEGTRQLIKAAKTNGSPHLVFISIVGIDTSPFPYFQAKLQAEQLIEQSGLPWSILRATQFHTYILAVITSFEDDQAATISIPAGSRFQPIETSEVADALVTLAEGQAAGRAADVGGPEILMLDEIAEAYVRVLHKRRDIQTHMFPGDYFDAFRDDAKVNPDRAVGHMTWEQFLQQQAH